jgi:hypothetical protein
MTLHFKLSPCSECFMLSSGQFGVIPYSVTLLPIGSGYFRANPFPVRIPQHFSNLVILHLHSYEDGTDSVPKRRHIKFRRREITQKKT